MVESFYSELQEKDSKKVFLELHQILHKVLGSKNTSFVHVLKQEHVNLREYVLQEINTSWAEFGVQAKIVPSNPNEVQVTLNPIEFDSIRRKK